MQILTQRRKNAKTRKPKADATSASPLCAFAPLRESPPPNCRADRPQTLRRLSVRRNFSWIALGNLVNAACCWGRVVLLARVAGAETIGQLVLAFAVCNPITTLADLGLGSVLVSDAKRQHRFADYLGLRLVTSLLALLAIVGVVLSGQYDPRTAGLIVLAGLAVALESVCEIFHARLQQQERMDFVGVSLMVRAPLGLTLLSLGTWWTGDLRWGILGFSAAAIGTLLLIDMPCVLRVARSNALDPCRLVRQVKQFGQLDDAAGRPLRLLPDCPAGEEGRDLPTALAAQTDSLAGRAGRGLRQDTRHPLAAQTDPPAGRAGRGFVLESARRLTALAWLSLPLGIVATSMALTTSLPRYAISHYLNAAALGAFAVAGGLAVATGLFVGAMSQAAGPRMAHLYAAGDKTALVGLLRRLLLLVAAVGVVQVAVMALAGAPILKLLYGRQFACYANLALCLALAAAIKDLATPLTRALNSMRRFRTNMAVRVVSIALLAGLLPVLVERYGLMGASWAIALSCLYTLAANGACVRVAIRQLRQGSTSLR
jgi:O-antigen/teichoic acid export membrane protein